MPDIFDETAEFMRTITHPFHHHHHGAPQPAAPAAPAIPHNDNNQEVTPMSVATEARNALDAAIGFVEKWQGNPIIDGLEQLGLSELSITPGEVQAVTTIIASLHSSHQQPAPAPAAEPDGIQPATGPYVAGQA